MGRRNGGEAGNTAGGIWKIGKYIRLSREDGGNESESIANQRKILDEKIAEYFTDAYEVVGDYVDDGQTGTSDETRPAFLRLTEDVKCGKINCIITKNISRAFRNSANQGRFLEEFIPLYHTRFISLYEPQMDTFLNPEIVHSLEVSLMGFLNEQYAYKTSVDIRRTFDTKRRRGEFIGAFAPYGYQKSPQDKNRLMIDAEAAAVVREIYHWFVHEGMSKSGITQRLNELGIPNPTAYKRKKGLRYCNPRMYESEGLWSAKTVREILRNEVYIGNMVQGRQRVISYKVHERRATERKDWYIVENTHEPIIDGELFAQAQRLQERDTRAAVGKRRVSLFSGFLRCADCGRAMTRHVSKGYAYYYCTTYTRRQKSRCTKHTIREDVLEKAVLAALQRQLSFVEDWEGLLADWEAAPIQNAEAERISALLAERKRERERLLAVTDLLYLDWKSGVVSAEEYHRRRESFGRQTERLRETIARLEEETLAKERQAEEAEAAVLLRQRTIPRLERGLLAALVDVIEIHEGGGVTIVFRFTDTQAVLHEAMHR